MKRGLAVTALLLALPACTKPPLVQQGQAFGTTVSVAISGEEEPRARQAAMAVLTELDGLSKRWDPWQPSELADLNAALAQGSTPQPADPALLESAGPILTHGVCPDCAKAIVRQRPAVA